MKNKLVLICLFFTFCAKSQSSFLNNLKKPYELYKSYSSFSNSPFSNRRSSLFTDEIKFSIGLSAGQETFIGLPKGGAYYEILLTKKQPYPNFGFHRFSFYTGVEGSIFIVFAGVLNISGTLGLSLGPITIDNSFSYTLVSSPEGFGSHYKSYNPKLGIQIGPVWLKGGPSFILPNTEEPFWGHLFKINDHPYNFELLYIVPL